MRENVLIGFGSNLGDRRLALDGAWALFGEHAAVETLQISRFYETRPVGGPPDQPDYLNAVGLIRTTLEPEPLLYYLQDVEARFGRVRTGRWGARTLDLDLLLYGDRIVASPLLTIPHPEMTWRDFVLEPAWEVAPEMIHPTTGLSLAELRRRLHDASLPGTQSPARVLGRPAN